MTLLLLLILAQNDRAAEAVQRSLPPELGVVELQAPRLSGEIIVEWPQAPRAGTQSVRLHSGRRASWAQVKLGALQKVLVAKVDLPENQPIVDGEVAVEEKPLAGWRVDPNVLIGAHPRRALHAGDVIQAADLILPPPLPRGLEMRVVMHRPGLEITTTAVLERPARRGERTIARLQQRLINARVIDDTTLEIEP